MGSPCVLVGSTVALVVRRNRPTAQSPRALVHEAAGVAGITSAKVSQLHPVFPLAPPRIPSTDGDFGTGRARCEQRWTPQFLAPPTPPRSRGACADPSPKAPGPLRESVLPVRTEKASVVPVGNPVAEQSPTTGAISAAFPACEWPPRPPRSACHHRPRRGARWSLCYDGSLRRTVQLTPVALLGAWQPTRCFVMQASASTQALDTIGDRVNLAARATSRGLAVASRPAALRSGDCGPEDAMELLHEPLVRRIEQPVQRWRGQPARRFCQARGELEPAGEDWTPVLWWRFSHLPWPESDSS